LDWLKPGTKASDYKCPDCDFWFQLKSKKSPIGKSIRDGAYAAMMEAIREDRAPSYFFLQYEICRSRREEAQTSSQEFQMEPPDVGAYGSGGEPAIWLVRNLLLVPSFAFPPSAIIKCPPLSPTARRAGWVGCNFDLSRIPAEARIEIVSTRRRRGDESQTEKSAIGNRQSEISQRLLTSSPTVIIPPSEVREQFKRVKPLKDISIAERGWTLDVLNIVRRVSDSRRRGDESLIKASGQSLLTSAPTFTNEDIYAFARELEQLHPDNRHVRDKIRQQLQVLRDAKLLIHVSSGLWRLP
jgi:type II restriction enzyme